MKFSDDAMFNLHAILINFMPEYKTTIKRSPSAKKIHLFLKNGLEFLSVNLKAIKSSQSPFIKSYPPGHHYSPFPDIDEIVAKWDLNFKSRKSKECIGIDLRENAQLELLDKFSFYYGDLPFYDDPNKEFRYYYDNGYFSYADAVVLFGTLLQFRPTKVIEIGSGFSSALMLDTNDMHPGSSTEFVFIEPFPDRLRNLLRKAKESRFEIIAQPLQKVSLSLFEGLGEDDILFIDSSHVVKPYSDVMRIFWEILPALKPGVLIHFHDICWPFEYPKEWFRSGRAWNEAYVLKAFLQYNTRFEILYFNSFMNLFYSELVKKKMPLCLCKPSDPMVVGASSLWIRKTG